MERDIQAVCNGVKNANETYKEMKNEMENIFKNVLSRVDLMKDFLIKYLQTNKNNSYSTKLKGKAKDIKLLETENQLEEYENEEEKIIINKTIIPANCNKCNNPLQILINKYKSLYIGCSGYPKCSNIISLNYAKSIYKTNKKCLKCGSSLLKIKAGKTIYDNCLSKCFMENEYKLQLPLKKTNTKIKIKQNEDTINLTHDSNLITKNNEKSLTFEKVCSVCGIVGRHPRNSGCLGVKKRNMSKKHNENFLV